MPLPVTANSLPSSIGGGAAGEAVDLLDVLGRRSCQTSLAVAASKAVTMPSASTANTRPPATTGPARSREPPPAPAPMLGRQATVDRVGGRRCCMAWVGLPPACGQSGLRSGGGSTTLSSARRGSALELVLDQQHRLALARQGRRPASRRARCPRRSRRGGPRPPSAAARRRDGALTSSACGGRAADRLQQLGARAAAARAARRPPRSAPPGSPRASSRSPARIASSARSSRAWLRQGAPAAASGSSVLLERRPGRRCRAGARPPAAVPRSRRIGSLRAAGGQRRPAPPRPRPRPSAPSLASASLQPGQRGKARLAVGCQGRELRRPPRPGCRPAAPARPRRSGWPRPRARCCRPMVPADLGRGGRPRSGRRAPGPGRRSAATASRTGRAAAPRRPRG